MDQLSEKAEPEPGQRSVRRRLVQSTLVPQKSPEVETNGADQNADKECEVEGDNEDDQDFGGGSQGKKTRKRKGKTTPQATKSSKKAILSVKEKKSPKNTTPKKKGIANGKVSSNLMESEEASPPIPNLRLEAKLTAEENSRMFAGKQMHPFFSSWKTEKKNQEMNEVDNNYCLIERKDSSTTIGPIHVLERIQDGVVSIDWGNWRFCENTVTNRSSCLDGILSSGFEGSVESLKFEKFHSDLLPYDVSLLQDKVCTESSDQRSSQEHLIEITAKVSVRPIEDKEEDQLDESTFSGHAASVRKSDMEEKSTFYQERMMSYCNGCDNQPKDSLWTDKYRPKSATEVCGNNESVKFMSEWLQSWHEKEFQAIKDSSIKCSTEDDSHDYYEVGSDSENKDEGDGLKNVLLVTGPIGSGKSAAIHACANERGFKVLENNTSDCRLGSVVKQKFGEALESHCLNRSLGSPLDLLHKNDMGSSKILCNGEMSEEVDDEPIQVIRTSDKENSHQAVETSDKSNCNERTVHHRADVKPLILFEDVDIIFPEDRGFIAAIQQIAEKAKGPVILTSNSNDVILPDNLNRLAVSFTMPSAKDLLSHLYRICAAEKVDIQQHLLEQLIGHCQTDIRKSIMHLQFWCLDKRYGKDKRMQKLCSPQLFDAEAGHLMLPKMIPLDFPSQLSEIVENEIAKSLSMMEENSVLSLIAEGGGHKKMLNSQDNNEKDSIEAKKEAMLSRNCYVHTVIQLGNPLDPACGFSNFPGTPVSFSRRNIKRKVNVVTSSDSEDEHLHYRCPPVADRDTKKELFPEDYNRFPSQFLNMQDSINPLTENLFQSEAEKVMEKHHRCSEIPNNIYMNDTCKSVDISCVPDSTFVPETEIDNEAELLSEALSSGYVAETVEVSVGNGFDLNLTPVEADDKSLVILHKSSDMLGSICDVEPSEREEVEESQSEQVEAVFRGYQVLDECSRIDFDRRSKPVEKLRPWVAVDLVKESWNKLLGSKADLKQYVTSEKTDACQIVKLAYGMCNLISEYDLLLSNCQILEFFKLSEFPCEESDAFSQCNEHVEMTSAITQHGFCFYTKNVSTVVPNMGTNRMKDLCWEMLSCTTNMMPSGKLIGQDVGASRTLHAGSGLELNPPKTEIFPESEMKSSLFNTVKSIVPKRSYLALKGYAFHEYLSSLACISRSDTLRLSEFVNKTKKRRTRGARHYLSTGALTFSPEEISVLGQTNLYRKKSSH